MGVATSIARNKIGVLVAQKPKALTNTQYSSLANQTVIPQAELMKIQPKTEEKIFYVRSVTPKSMRNVEDVSNVKQETPEQELRRTTTKLTVGELEKMSNLRYYEAIREKSENFGKNWTKYNRHWPYDHFYKLSELYNLQLAEADDTSITLKSVTVKSFFKVIVASLEDRLNNGYGLTDQEKSICKYLQNDFPTQEDRDNCKKYFLEECCNQWFIDRTDELCQQAGTVFEVADLSKSKAYNTSLLTGMSSLDFFKKLVSEGKIDIMEFYSEMK
jgi:hypothetical protein